MIFKKLAISSITILTKHFQVILLPTFIVSTWTVIALAMAAGARSSLPPDKWLPSPEIRGGEEMCDGNLLDSLRYVNM